MGKVAGQADVVFEATDGPEQLPFPCPATGMSLGEGRQAAWPP